MSRLCATVVAACFAFGCSADSREEPSPAQMCRQLADECADLGRSRFDDCAQIGERGIDDPTQEDRCYVYYDSCIHECRYVTEWGPFDTTPDASADAGSEGPASDAGGADAAAN